MVRYGIFCSGQLTMMSKATIFTSEDIKCSRESSPGISLSLHNKSNPFQYIWRWLKVRIDLQSDVFFLLTSW